MLALLASGVVIVLGKRLATGGVGEISLILFFVALPFANALLDWPSWWVSRRLGRHLLKVVPGNRSGAGGAAATEPSPARSSASAAGWLGAHVLFDLGAAIVCLWGLAVLLPFVIELFNLWSLANGNPKPLALRPFLNQAVNNPWPDGLSVLAMLLSTLVPTLLHAMALIASPLMVWLGPSQRRRAIATGLLQNDPSPAAIRSAAWHMTWTWLIDRDAAADARRHRLAARRSGGRSAICCSAPRSRAWAWRWIWRSPSAGRSLERRIVGGEGLYIIVAPRA